MMRQFKQLNSSLTALTNNSVYFFKAEATIMASKVIISHNLRMD